MNETSAIIPVAPDEATVSAMIVARREMTPMQMAQMRLPELKELRRAEYERAVAMNLPLIFKLLVSDAGTPGPGANQKFWQTNGGGDPIHAVLDDLANTIHVMVANKVKCSDVVPGEELFVFGPWVIAMLDHYRRMSTVKRRALEAAEERERRQLIELFSPS